MKKNKILYSLALALCLLVLPFISACNNGYETRYVWNTTFVYNDVINNNYASYSASGDVNGKTYYNLAKDEFNNKNIDLTNVKFDGISVDISACDTVETLFSTIEGKVSDIFSERLKGMKIAFGDKGENITINNKTYAIAEATYAPDLYDVKDLETSESYGLFTSTLVKVQNHDYTLNPAMSALIPNTIYVSLITKSVVDDPSASYNPESKTSTINLCYYALFIAE